MNIGLSDRIRALAKTRYVNPAIHEGKSLFSIRVRDVHEDLKAEGFPPRHTPQICEALTGRKFLRENGLEIEEILGPPSRQSPTVVVRYRLANSQPANQESTLEREQPKTPNEDPEDWALRVTEKIRGLLKDEIAQFGGAEAFIRWVRSEDEDAE